MRKLLVVLFAAAFVAGSFIPALAVDFKGVDINFDGRVQFDTYWSDTDDKLTGTNWDDTEVTWAEHDSRFRIKFAKGPLKAQFEVQDGKTPFNTFWAEWNFGPGFLWIGRDDPLTFNPTDLPPPRGTYCGVAVGAAAADAIRLRFPMGPVTLTMQAMTPVQDQFQVTPFTVSTDKELPAFEAKLDFMLGPVACAIFGGWNSYSEVTSLNKEYDIDSSIYGLVVRWFAGPFSFHGAIYDDTNSYNSYPPPWPTEKFIGQPTYNAVNDTIVDTENIGFHLNANYQLNDMVGFSIGYGENSIEDDNNPQNEEDGSSWWIAVPIKVTDFFTISPHYNVADFEDTTTGGVSNGDRGKVKYYGVHWQINF
jgi:hypothetical protein